MEEIAVRRRAQEMAQAQGSKRRDAMSAQKILEIAKEEEKSGDRKKAEELYQLALAADSEHAGQLACCFGRFECPFFCPAPLEVKFFAS